MASGKHRRGKRKRPRHAPAGNPLERARQSLDKGDGRSALDQLRQAQRGDEHPPELPLLFFCACTQRARQLVESGLDSEADAMRARAARHRASISARTLEEGDLVRYLRHLDGHEALAVYADSLKARAPLPPAERLLADRLVSGRCWEHLEVLEAEHPLRRDAGLLAPALETMDAGDWKQAAARLQGLPRRSPFAAWRVFCKAMLCFGAGDDEGLRRALDHLPADFALAGTVAEWRRVCTGKGGGGPVEVRRALGTDDAAVETLGEDLLRALRKKGRPRTIETLIARLADAVHPADPVEARMDLLQIAGLAVLRDRLTLKAVHGMMRRLLPAERVAGTAARVPLMLQQVSPSLWDPAPAAAYLDRLPVEFPRASDQALARGRVFEALARSGRKAVQPEYLPDRMVETLSALLGEWDGAPEMLFAELMMASLAADPDNREGYRFLLEVMRGNMAGKARLRRILEDMAARFPDDPDPWLELATLHYSRNAYRRAEHALGEARGRAPHDERILDLQAIGFLKSADQSRKKGRFELAARDLRRAADLGRPKLEAVSRAKQLLLEVVSAGRDAAGAVAPCVESLPPGARIRTLALLLHDLQENSRIKNVRPEMEGAVRGLLARAAPAIDALAPDEAVALLAPLSPDLRILYGSLQIAPVLEEWWAALMKRVDGERLLAVFDMLMDCGRRAPVRTEINRRLRGARGTRRDPLLLLYLAVIRFQEGHDHDSRRFAEALAGVSASERKRLRAAASRLARHTQGILRQALQEFDFEVLNLPPPLFGDGALDPVAELLDELFGPARRERRDEPSFEEFLEGLSGGGAAAIPEVPRQGALFDDETAGELEALEALIDDNGLRGASLPVIQDFAATVRADPELRRLLDRTARACEAAGLRDGLSREARAFLFPRKGRRRHS